MKHYNIYDTDIFLSEFEMEWVISQDNEDLHEKQKKDRNDSLKECVEGTFFG